MANMIVASSKTLIPIPAATAGRGPKPRYQVPKSQLPKIPTTHQLLSSAAVRSSSAAAAAILGTASPSLAEGMEKAKLFEFNLTLPIMMVQFLVLMVALDKIYYTPLGKFMDERDAAIKEKLASVKDTSEEVRELEEKAEAAMRAARAEIAAALNQMKKETQAEMDVKLAEARKKVEAELQEARAKLEIQKEETIKSLDSQIAAISEDIVKKVLPV